jgi:hypothetical protein
LTDPGIVPVVDEGSPIAYQLLDRGVPVLASDGTPVGSVKAVLAAPEQDVFHGLLIETSGRTIHFVEAASIASLHEHGVDLRIGAADIMGLPGPEHSAPVYHEDPAEQGRWHHWVHRLSGRGDWDRER